MSVGMDGLRAQKTSSSGRRVCTRKATMEASSRGVRVVLLRSRGPIGESSTPSLLRHLATVLGLTPWRRANAATDSLELWNSALVRIVVVALPCRSCAIVPPSRVERTLHHDTLGLHT